MMRPPRQRDGPSSSPASDIAPKQQRNGSVHLSPAAEHSFSNIIPSHSPHHPPPPRYERYQSTSTTCNDSLDLENNELRTEPSLPPPVSSPSALSSAASSSPKRIIISPSQRRRSPTSLRDELAQPDTQCARADLARRLVNLAQRLRLGDDTALDVNAVAAQLDQWEGAASDSRSPALGPPRSLGGSSRGDASCLLSSIGSPLIRSRFSDLTASMQRERQRRQDREDETRRVSRGMTSGEANKIVAETDKLNDELATVIRNLRARQEESDHIHALLIERAERAAQRIIFLQNRIAYLENELQENDNDLQHLRISLKAVEVQLPPHPDLDLQRCIATIHRDYQALKQKRANRQKLATVNDLDVHPPAR